MKTLHFHTGRGGAFHNAGHITFRGFQTIQQTSLFDEYYFYYDQEMIDDPEIVTGDRKPGWYTASGNELDCQINEDGTGYINADYEYDSDHWVKENELSEIQQNVIIRAINNSYMPEIEELEQIIREHYPERVHEIEEQEAC